MANPSAPVAKLLSRLTGVEEAGSEWKARCPAHEDSSPSLSVREGDDGRALVKCFAGCTAEAIVAALDLTMAALFPDKTLIARQKGNDEPETVYRYRDLDGKVLFEVCRSRDAQGKKKFLQRRYHEGRIVWSLKAGKYRLDNDSYRAVKAGDRADGAIELPAVKPVLYRLPEIQSAIKDGSWIVVCEGEKDAENGAKLGLATTTNPGGAGKWQESYSKALAGARVAIVPDNDQPGQDGAQKVAVSLRAQGIKVRVVDLEGGTVKGYDLSDWIAEKRQAGLTEPEIRQELLEKIETAIAAQAGPQKPRIAIEHNRMTVGNQAVALLAGRPEIYRRGGSLIHVVSDMSAISESLQDSIAPILCQVTQARIIEVLSDSADWISHKGRPCAPPDWLAKAILGRPSWDQIKRLERIVEFPIVRPDGSICETPGYDSKTELIYAPNCRYPPFPAVLDSQAARLAAERLREVVYDFPFTEDADFSAWIAGLLTIVGRSAFKGPSPLFVISANIAGSGKSLLVDATSTIVFGRAAPRMTQSDNDAEERKRITALASSGASVVLIDNVDHPLGSAPLNAALTAQDWSDRILGESVQRTFPMKLVFFATGNDITIRGDTNRRYLAIEIRPDAERPDRRTDFRHPRLLEWIRMNRGTLLVAAMTILASYFKAGKPAFSNDAWGSYEDWSAVIRNAVIFAGLPDPCEKRDALEAVKDPEDSIIYQVLRAWRKVEIKLGKSLALSEVLALPETDEVVLSLWQALGRFCGLSDYRQLKPRSIGNRFKSVRDRDYNGLRLCQVGEKGEFGKSWTVVDAYENSPQ